MGIVLKANRSLARSNSNANDMLVGRDQVCIMIEALFYMLPDHCDMGGKAFESPLEICIRFLMLKDDASLACSSQQLGTASSDLDTDPSPRGLKKSATKKNLKNLQPPSSPPTGSSSKVLSKT